MTLSSFTIKPCSNNARRWYVSFNPSRKFQLQKVKEILVKKQYQVLTITPTVMVFKLENIRLTWHSQGLIQVDMYGTNIETSKGIEQLIKEILGSMNNIR
ncbi:MAG: hypothetical protein ACFFAU_21160 [Candidatus Hodarchaeota archaeon]